MNDRELSPRLTAMRDAIAAQVDATGATAGPRRRPRPTRTTMIAVVAAFVLGSGLTGALTAAALPGINGDTALETELATSTRYQVEQGNHATLVGSPVFRTDHGDATIPLGRAPERADRVTLSWTCRDATTLTVTVDGTVVGGPTRCRPGSSTPEWAMQPLSASRRATVTVTSSDASAQYGVWLSWAKAATIARPSAQQAAETADGVVTQDEYTAAFNRLQACMTQAGIPTGTTPLSWFKDGLWSSRPSGQGPWYLYSTPSDGLDVFDTQCSPREFADVDAIWQQEHPMPVDPPAQPSDG
ncbi:hypothetical protein ACLBWP_02850 [Microbacterium sp. M1A1_1b]